MLAVGSSAGRICLVDAETGKLRWGVQGCLEGRGSPRVKMSPDGRFVASVGGGEVCWKLWDAETGGVEWMPRSGVEWLAGARHDGTGSCRCKISLDQVPLGCPVVAHTAGVNAVAFSPCGQRLATGGDDHAVILWDADSRDAQTGKEERSNVRRNGDIVMRGHSQPVITVAFSSEGEWVASGGSDGSICVWEAATGALLRTMRDESHEDRVSCVHFSPRDKNILASVGEERTTGNNSLLLWDVATGEKLQTFLGVFFAVFSPDGRSIATAGTDLRAITVIDLESGAVRWRMAGHDYPVRWSVISVSFSPDSSKLASTTGSDNTCEVWDLSTGALLRTIDIGRNATFVDWGRDWVREASQQLAFAMGHHPRLGAESQVLDLEVGVVRMILDHVK